MMFNEGEGIKCTNAYHKLMETERTVPDNDRKEGKAKDKPVEY